MTNNTSQKAPTKPTNQQIVWQTETTKSEPLARLHSHAHSKTNSKLVTIGKRP